MKTYVYVDGFNLYYRALAHSRYKWLDLRALAASLLRKQNAIETIRYYTARVSGRQDRGQPKRQESYLKALRTIPGLTIHYGKFLPKVIRRPLASSPPGRPVYVEVHSTEEKGSDVNLASHLLWDGFQGAYEVAVVVSKDTDLVEPIRIVTQELRMPVGLICPDGAVPSALEEVMSFVRHVTSPKLAASQFPNPVFTREGKAIYKPAQW